MLFDDDQDMDNYDHFDEDDGIILEGEEETDSDNEERVKDKIVEQVSTLKDICLNSVSTNFPRFKVAFNSTEDPVLRHSLQFLRRVYTAPVLGRAIEDGYFDADCLNFLINEHLKELNFNIFDLVDIKKVIQRISEIGHGFVKVNLLSECLDQLFVNRIVSLIPNVTVLRISVHCSEETIKIISSSCPKLEELYLESCFTEELCDCLRFLSLHCLRTLSLMSSLVDESTLCYLLDSLPALEVLDHYLLPHALYKKHRHDLTNDTLSSAKKYKIASLDLTGEVDDNVPTLTEIVTICAAVCPSLKTLSIGIEKESNLELISQFSAIENLTLDCMGSNMNLNKFLVSNGEKLKELRVTHFELSLTTLIHNCPNLQSVMLSDISFENVSTANFTKRLNMLRDLKLENMNFTEHFTETSMHLILNCSPNIEKLVISNSELENSSVNAVLSNYCANSILQSVRFSNSDVEGVLLESILLNCATLNLLVIEYCDNINSDVIQSLYQISYSKQNAVEIIWNDDKSEQSSIYDDFIDNIIDNYDDYDDYDAYDSDVSYGDNYYDSCDHYADYIGYDEY